MGYTKSFTLTKEQEAKVAQILKELQEKYKLFDNILCEGPDLTEEQIRLYEE
jgi:K+/H+ antiporter YhaU regulatory subunit KhtT